MGPLLGPKFDPMGPLGPIGLLCLKGPQWPGPSAPVDIGLDTIELFEDTMEPLEQLGPKGPFILGPLILVGTGPIGPFRGPFIEPPPKGLCKGGPIGLLLICPPGIDPILFMGLPIGPPPIGEPMGMEFIGLPSGPPLMGLPIER